MLALVEYERGIHACGIHKSLAFDRANAFTFEHETCPVCAGAEQYHRRLAERDELEKKAAGDTGPLSSDGRATYVRQMGVDERAERDRAAQERRQRRVSK